MKNLIIVESPAKARTITNFLGKEYKVIASKGHIRDLPKSTFGITLDEDTGDLVPKYSIPRDANPTVKELKKLAKEAETVFIATDEDREGEAIGYHIAKAIGKESSKEKNDEVGYRNAKLSGAASRLVEELKEAKSRHLKSFENAALLLQNAQLRNNLLIEESTAYKISRIQNLEKYSRDLTKLAREGKLDPVIGRDAEILRVIQIL